MRHMLKYIGEKYNRLTIISKSDRKHHYNAICDCGVEKEYYIYNVLSGHTSSCGCSAKEQTSIRSKTHGKSKNEPLYRIWADMKRRCMNEKRKEYKNYGGRGIKVCDLWATDFMAFYYWAIENGWNKELELDRKDNDGNYEPSNCRFVSIIVNANNKRDNKYINFNGEIKTLSEWARQYKIEPMALNTRLKNNWDIQDALTFPVKKKGGDPSKFRYVRSIKYSFGHIN